MDDSERTYGYSEDIYHGRRGPGGHYGTNYQRTDSARYYPQQPHFERSYEYADRLGQGMPRRGETSPEEAAVNVRGGEGPPTVSEADRAAAHHFRSEMHENRESWTWDVEGPFRGRGPKGYRRSDERIFEDVCDRLESHGRIDASEIEVSVEDAEVTLNGTVESRRTKRMAENVVDTVRGVYDVHNRLTLRERGESEGEGEEPS